MAKNSIKRLREIVKVFTSYGFGYLVDNKLKKTNSGPKNLRKAFEELGPTFIKIGQILSTRPDILSNKYIEELSKLQDSTVEESFDSINKVFFDEFNKNIDEVFLQFNKKPFASASIAQVYEAKLKNGQDVIVKIQRPNISENIHLDLSILLKIFSLTKANKFIDALIDPKEVIKELIKSTERELDFSYEAKNLEKFKLLNQDVKCIYVPFLVKELCGKKVLTMEKINGFKITNTTQLLENGYDLNDIGKKLAFSYCKQIFKDGFFHGDPHPGNLLIKEGTICFLDFGIVGNISKSMKEALNEMILAAAYNDINKMISAVFSIGIRRGYVDRNKLFEDIDYIFASYLNTNLKNIKISVMLQEIFDACKKNNIQLPKDLTLLIRSMVIVEGVISDIAPDIKILDVIIPYVKSNNQIDIFKDFSFDKLKLNSYIFLRNIEKLPGKSIDLIESILTGRAKIRLEHKDLKESVTELNKMINRLIFALVICSMIIGSSLILNSNIGPKLYDMSILGLTGFFIAAILGFWLLISIFKSGKM